MTAVALLSCRLWEHAGYLDEHGTPRDFATRPNGGTATLLSLTQVQRAMAKIASMEKQKHAAPARPSAPKRPRPRSPSPELDISDDDEPEGAHPFSVLDLCKGISQRCLYVYLTRCTGVWSAGMATSPEQEFMQRCYASTHTAP